MDFHVLHFFLDLSSFKKSFNNLYFYFSFVDAFMCMSGVCVHMTTGTNGDQKTVPGSLELELQAVVN